MDFILGLKRYSLMNLVTGFLVGVLIQFVLFGILIWFFGQTAFKHGLFASGMLGLIVAFLVHIILLEQGVPEIESLTGYYLGFILRSMFSFSVMKVFISCIAVVLFVYFVRKLITGIFVGNRPVGN